MKRYKLLKDLPFAQAGDIFKMMDDDGREVLAPEEWLGYRHKIVIEKLENLDDWFEETKELKKYWFVDGFGGINIGIIGEYLNTERKLKDRLAKLEEKIKERVVSNIKDK
ncbi:MAG: hypothetical protein Q4A21_02230 [bacterium]|nr:hypothetical protein [bacterium]